MIISQLNIQITNQEDGKLLDLLSLETSKLSTNESCLSANLIQKEGRFYQIISNWEGANTTEPEQFITQLSLRLKDSCPSISTSHESFISLTDGAYAEELNQTKRLLLIIEKLRKECPWDKKQTIHTLRNLTIEEVYELADAINDNDLVNIKKELGDILLHIYFYTIIGTEQQAFSLTDVLNAISEKLIYRHPHIFADTSVVDAQEVEANWEKLKLKEKGGNKSVLAGVPRGLPAMIKAHRIQDKARAVGFDWDHRDQVWGKILEELEELKHEVDQGNQENTTAEFGDVIFSIINAARLYKVDPENALELTNRKFIHRFNFLEERAQSLGLSLKEMSLNEMDKIWEEAKKTPSL